jgi:hypothetical protein
MNRYQDIKLIRNTNPNVGTMGTLFSKPVFYPEIPELETDIYVITEFGDRLDLLANQFYQDVTLWWIISCANPNKINFGSLTIAEGTQLRIPMEISNILGSYRTLNNV